MDAEKSLVKILSKGKFKKRKEKLIVYPIRDWKEYVGESVLIIFSVLLALILTEYINSNHEKDKTREILRSLVTELNNNKKAIQEIRNYNAGVLQNIDKVLRDKSLQRKMVSGGEFHLDVIAPAGVLFRYPEKDAWMIARSNNILAKIDISTISGLTQVYEDLDRVTKVEEGVAKIIFDRASREQEQLPTTLILIKDTYRAWAVDRLPGLLMQIDRTIQKVESNL